MHALVCFEEYKLHVLGLIGAVWVTHEKILSRFYALKARHLLTHISNSASPPSLTYTHYSHEYEIWLAFFLCPQSYVG